MPSGPATPPPRDSVDAVVGGWREVRDDLDVAPVEVVTRLARVRAFLEHEMEVLLAEHGLTSASFSALAAIARLEGADGVTQVGLMRALQLTSGTVSVRVDRLVAEGLVERRPDPDDRRGTRITLTPRGRAAFEQAAPAHLENERMLLAALAPDDQERLAGLLRVLLLDYEGCAASEHPGRVLGLTLVPAHETARMRRRVGLPEQPGLLVRAVDRDGPAARAGLRPGDLLVRAGDRVVRSAVDLHAVAAAGLPPRGLRAVLVRAESEVAVRITPG